MDAEEPDEAVVVEVDEVVLAHLAPMLRIGAIDNPPLDHEDGTVYGACKRLEGDNPLATVYCVTRD